MMSNTTNANKEFVCSYSFDGHNWSTTVWASTHEEAEMKLRAMASGTVDGVLGGVVPHGGRCPTCGKDMDTDRRES
jgi:hypothetical protein